ncbi:aldehyde dehydrogenase family protein [Actinomadura sp. 9N407]|uniref:aldehyde dehydrogenase family protein n=1 Tax=Actinomadura sp. 9N407 TaxID=3375154 RepID=UPI0037AEE9C7
MTFLSKGEVCVASTRLLLHEDIADEFLGRIASGAASIKVGDALDPETQNGPASVSLSEAISLRLMGDKSLLPCSLFDRIER